MSIDSYQIKKDCKEEWEAKPHIREGLGTLEVYKAFKQAEAEGRFKMIMGGR